MKLIRTATRPRGQVLTVQAGALSLTLHAVALAALAFLPGTAPARAQAQRVVTLAMLPPTEVMAAMPEPLLEPDEVSEVDALLTEDQLEEPETVTRVFPPEPPEPPPRLDPLPFDDPRGVRIRVAPFAALPIMKLEEVADTVLPPPAEADMNSAPDTPDAPGETAAEEPGPTRGPLFVDGPEPDYPGLSKRLGEQGSVHCRLFIAADGRVMRVELVQSSGFPRLDRAALEALRHWRFLAALDEGLSIPAQFTHTVRFRIE